MQPDSLKNMYDQSQYTEYTGRVDGEAVMPWLGFREGADGENWHQGINGRAAWRLE